MSTAAAAGGRVGEGGGGGAAAAAGRGDIETLMQNLDSILIEEPDENGGPSSTYSGLGGAFIEASAPQAPSASEFSNARLIEEMEVRKIRPTGFRDQDIVTLQRVLDEEFEREKENILQQQREQREKAIKQAGLQRKRALLERQIQQEKMAIAEDHRVKVWLSRLASNSTPTAARIAVNSITARSLAKAMWHNNSLIDLDLSRNDLDDFSGAYVAKLFKRNATVEKLEIGQNNLGRLTCQSLAEALSVNTTLKHLGLDLNPLTSSSEYEQEVAKSLASLIRQNSSITSLNLWRCGLGPEVGKAIAAALEDNSRIRNLDIGMNNFTERDLKRIRWKLDVNAQLHADEMQNRRAEGERQRSIQLIEEKIADQLRKERELVEWLESQRCLRAEARRREKEDAYAEDRRRIAEEEAAKEAELEAQRKAAEALALKKAKKAAKKKK